MTIRPKELWRELAEQASVEQDQTRLLELATEINRLLQEKETHLAELRKDTFTPRPLPKTESSQDSC